jgi:AcrR family transcriptional regulator
MTPYRYFASKDEIFDAVRTAAFARFADRQERAASGPGDVRERLLALGRDYVAFARKEPDAYRIMFELGQDGLSERRELWTESKRAWRPMHTAVADAVAAGPFGGDVETLAHLFWAGVHGIVTLHLAGKLELGRTLEELVEPMLTTLFAGNERGDDNERT